MNSTAQCTAATLLIAVSMACVGGEVPPSDLSGTAEYWIGVLAERIPGHRDSAIAALTNLGSTAVPLLIPLLHSDDSGARAAASETLFAIGPEAEAAFPSLLEHEFRTVDGVRMAIASGEMLGPRMIPTLMSLLARPGREASFLRINAGIALASLGPSIIPTLTHALTHPDGYVRYGAAEALGHLGPDGAAAIPALIAVVRNTGEELEIRDRASQSLGTIGTAALDSLQELAFSRDSTTRRLGITATFEVRAGIAR